jgi:tol-pal system protein YbgF
MKNRNILIKAFFALILLSYFAKAIPNDYYEQNSFDIYQKAFNFFDKKLMSQTEIIIKKFLDDNSFTAESDRAVILHAFSDYANGNYKFADDELDKFIQNKSNSPFIAIAAYKRAVMAFDQKKYLLAESLFNTSKRIAENEIQFRDSKIYPDLVHFSIYWRGVSFAQAGKYQDAQLVFEEFIQKYPKGMFTDDAYFHLGQIAELSKNYEIAISYYRTVSSKYEYSNISLASKIREININLILRNYQNAFIILERAENLNNHFVKNDSAVALYEKQSYIEHAGEEIMYLKGEAYNLSRNFDKALVIFESFLETYTESELVNFAKLGAGWALLNKSEYKKAIRHYNEIIASIKDDDSRVKGLAQLYRAVAFKRSGDIAQAQREFSLLSVQSGYPYLSNVLLELGQIYYENEDYENSIKTLERAEREVTDANISVRVNLLLGANFVETRKWNKAVNAYKAAEQLALKSSYTFMPQKDWYISEARLKQGISLVKNFRNNEAIKPLLSFIGSNKSSKKYDEALFWLAEAYYRSNLLNNSIETYQSIVDLYEDSKYREEALYGLGWSYFRLKKFKESSSVFDKMIKEFPDSKHNVEVLSRQGDGYYTTRDYKKAVESYRRAAKLSPNSEEGQYCSYQLCYALYRQGQFEDAISSLLAFVRNYNNSPYAPDALYLTGWIRFQQKKYKEAVDNFKFLIQAYPSSSYVVKAYYKIGDALYNLDNFDGAIESYKTVVESYPSHDLSGEALKGIYQCYIAQGKETEAMKVADSFVETNPNSAVAQEFKFKKADMFFTGKNYKDAVNEYENFINKYPDSDKNSEAIYWMGKSFLNLDDTVNAEKSFNKVIEKYPKSEFAPLSYLEKGLLYKNLKNDIAKAEEIFSKLMQNYPETQSAAQAGYERAIIKYTMNDIPGALSLFRLVEEKYPGMDFADQATYRIANYYFTKEINDTAKIEFEKLANKLDNPTIASEAQYRVGEILLKDKKINEAIAAFNLVKDRFNGYEDWYTLGLIKLGECYELNNENQKAVEIYTVIENLRANDDFGAIAKRKLKNLENK